MIRASSSSRGVSHLCSSLSLAASSAIVVQILDRQLAVAKESGQVRRGRFAVGRQLLQFDLFIAGGVVVLSAIALSRVATVSATISRFKGDNRPE